MKKTHSRTAAKTATKTAAKTKARKGKALKARKSREEIEFHRLYADAKKAAKELKAAAKKLAPLAKRLAKKSAAAADYQDDKCWKSTSGNGAVITRAFDPAFHSAAETDLHYWMQAAENLDCLIDNI